MRNLKRALSLALAFIMVMGLMIVGSSAKSYTDSDKIENQVAVEILGEIGAMIGEGDNFAPDRVVTRAEMATIMVRILYGNNLNVDQFKNMNTFTDVPDWAAGFVNLCASLDIVAGRGNGIFDPNATVTTAEATLMMARTLGYFKNPAEFGSDWALAAMKKGTEIGIIGGDMVLQANEGLVRDDVAQMTFNTLTKTVPVQYNELLDVYYNEHQGIIYALEFNYLQTLGYKNFGLVYKTNDAQEYGRPATTWGIGSYVVDGKGTASGIEKEDLTSDGGLKPEYVRMLAKDEIITVNNTPTYVYTENTKEKEVYSDLSATVCTKYDWTAFVNGKEEKTADTPAKNSGDQYKYTDKGTVTEVYVDDDASTVTVVEINYYLGQVYSVNDGTTTIRALSKEAKEGELVLDDRTFATEEFDKDDYVVFTVDYNDDDEYFICEMMAPDTVTGEVARVEKDSGSGDTYIRLDSKDGDKIYYTNTKTHMVYDVNNANVAKHPTLNEDYILYMTPIGYVLGFEKANEDVSEYLYVKDSYEVMEDWTAKVILPDASTPTVDLDNDLDNIKNSSAPAYPFNFANNQTASITDEVDWLFTQGFNNAGKISVWDTDGNTVASGLQDLSNIDYLIWDYSVSGSDVYSLTYVPFVNFGQFVTTTNLPSLYQTRYEAADADDYLLIQPDKAFVNFIGQGNDAIVDEDTIFVDTINGVSYTGYSEIPFIHATKAAFVVEDGVIQIMFILEGDVYDHDMFFFFLTKDTADTWETTDYDGDDYREYEYTYVDGKKQELTVAYDALDDHNTSLSKGVLYRANKSFVGDDDVRYITEVEEIANVDPSNGGIWGAHTVKSVGGNAFSLNDANFSKFTTNSDTTYVLVERNAKDVAAYEAARKAGATYTGGFEWTVKPGSLDDINNDRLASYVTTYVTVANSWLKVNTDRAAELVYIYQITPNQIADEIYVDFTGTGLEYVDVTVGETKYEVEVGDYFTFSKYDDVSLTIAPKAGYNQILDVTITDGTAAVIDNYDGTFTVKADDIAENVTVNVDAITAVGSVYVVDDEITVAYAGEKPIVEEAILAVLQELDEMYTGERSITWNKTGVNDYDHVYNFFVETASGNVIKYTWNAHYDFVEGVTVSVNGDEKFVAKNASVAEAFAAYNSDYAIDPIEGYVLNGDKVIGDADAAANATVEAGASYTDQNYKVITNKGTFYGQAGDELAADLTKDLDGNWVKLGNDGDDDDYYKIDDLTYGDLAQELDTDKDYVIDTPQLGQKDGYYKLFVDDVDDQYDDVYFTTGTENLSGKTSTQYGLRADGIIYDITNVTLTNDETIYTGYCKLNNSKDAETTLQGAFSTAATITWYDADGNELPQSTGGNSFALKGREYHAVVSFGTGFTAAANSNLAIAGTTRIVIDDELKDVAAVDTTDSTKVNFSKTGVVEDGDITFYGTANAATVNVTLTANNT